MVRSLLSGHRVLNPAASKTLALTAAVLAAVACTQSEPADSASSPTAEGGAATSDAATVAAVWRPVDDPDEVAAQRARADDARGAMFASLLGELMAAIDAGGHASAIDVCAERAPAIAREVADTQGVRIGRTSHRLRNPDNRVPPWAADAVDRRTAEPVEFVDGTTGTFATLTPIRLAPPCLACHGPADALADGVADALAARYPTDQATGFAEGDLRGWFWVEVPVEPDAAG